MRLIILSLLAIGAQSHASSIGIADTPAHVYRSGFSTYTPARGEFPVQSGLAQGYVRYIDDSGVSRLIGYNYPEPLHGIRRLSVDSDDVPNPLLRSSIENSGYYPQQQQQYLILGTNLDKTREQHFRDWCTQRYLALKSEVDKLRAEGKRPSSDILAQMQPLEQILANAAYGSSAGNSGESAELIRAREEHLRIWNEARLRGEATQGQQIQQPQSFGVRSQADVLLTSTGGVMETPEVMRAREEHLRLFNEAKLRAENAGYKYKEPAEQSAQFEGAAIKNANFDLSSDLKSGQYLPQHQEQQPILAQHTPQLIGVRSQADVKLTPTGEVMDTPEVIRAREEHLRLFNEAKLRAKNSGYKYKEPADHGAHLEGAAIKNANFDLNSDLKSGQYLPQQQEQQPILVQHTPQSIGVRSQANIKLTSTGEVMDTPEVIRAREEHLRLFNEAKLSAENSGYKYKEPTDHGAHLEGAAIKNANFDLSSDLKSGQYLPQQHEQHLQQNPQSIGVRSQAEVKLTATGEIIETPEVKHAREKHFRLFNEAKLRAENAEYKYKEPADHGAHLEGAAIKNANFDLSSDLKSGQYLPQQQEQQPILVQHTLQSIGVRSQANVRLTSTGEVMDTPEVIRAREEHLRLFNEAKLSAENSGYKYIEPVESSNQLEGAAIKKTHIDLSSDLKSGQYIQQQQEQQPISVQETAEVKRAREEHLKLFNEASKSDTHVGPAQAYQESLKQLSAGLKSVAGIDTSHSQASPIQSVEYTPEVLRAREEHLRLKADLESSQPQQQPIISYQKQEGGQPKPIMETAEVLRAREQHFKLLNEAKQRAEAAAASKSLEQPAILRVLPGIQQPIQSIKYLPAANHDIKSIPNVAAHIPETPEVQQAREEHLKLVQDAQLRDAQYQTGVVQPSFILRSSDLTTSQIQETPEVQRAREEHLKLVEAAKLRATQYESDTEIKDSGIFIQADNRIGAIITDEISVDELREIERSNAEEQQLIEAERLRESKRLQSEKQFITADAARLQEEERQLETERLRLQQEDERRLEMERLSETERLRLQQENERRIEIERLQEEKPQLIETPIIYQVQPESDYTGRFYTEEQRLKEAERLRESKRLQSEKQFMAADAARLQEEERLSEAERLRLQQEDERRIQMERQSEAKWQQEEKQQTPIIYQEQPGSVFTTQLKSAIQQRETASYGSPNSFVLSEQYKQNPFFLRFANQPSAGSIYVVAQEGPKAQQINPGYQINPQNSFLRRYTQNTRSEFQQPRIDYTTEDKPLVGKISEAGSLQKIGAQVKISYGEGSALSELEKATRDHFRAHAIALEQLREANLRNPNARDCN